ncbi:MAG: outer membrane beta-barrel domain-containing protein [Oligoflexia bacterium]|nr:outer membrane beta-barrel domain-containing protein [Oligoflexia bacterium]
MILSRTISKLNWVMALSVLLVVSSVAQAQEIPFDPNVPPPQGSFSGSESPEPAPMTPEEVEKELEAIPMSTPTPTRVQVDGKPKKMIPAELSGLGRLAPFSDVAVISRKYLPKTKRFEFFPNGGMVLNDKFFNSFVYGAKFGYYFHEHYGVELTGLLFGTGQKEVTRELESERNISTASLATPTNYMGIDFKWSPIYGKVAWLNSSIIPYDFYLTVGGGLTGTNQDSRPPTFHLGAGQLFAIKKWLAARWDISWFLYKTDSKVANRPGGTYTNLHATIGLSFFFPGAKYR